MKDGFILIDKAQDWTSHDCVAILRKYMKLTKVGHTGTLDPMATGLLLLAVGKATRMIEYTNDLDKTYIGRMRLGYETTTDDIWGEKTQEGPVNEDFLEKLQALVPKFLGEQDQLPPLYSAVRVGGRRLYHYARKGDSVEIKPRRVFIKDIQILGAGETNGFHEVEFKVVCGPGTFIRSLFRDLGRAIGSRASMSSLRRTGIGSLSVDSQKTVKILDIKQAYNDSRDNQFLWDSLLDLDRLISHLPYVELNLRRGRSFVLGAPVRIFDNELQAPKEGGGLLKEDNIRVYSKGSFLGIADKKEGMLVPKKVVMPGWKGSRND